MSQNAPNAGLEETLCELTLFARQDLEVSRHVFAGKVTYVLRDPITFESHRFSPIDYEIFVAMASGVQLNESFDELVTKKHINANAKQEFYQFAANLVQLGLLGLPSPNGKALFARSEKRKRTAQNGRLKNFLFQQIPLFNPDRFLDRTIHWARPLFSRGFAACWTVGFVLAAFIIIRRWSDFMDPMSDILTLKNIPMLWGILFGLKFFHEFGHAYACKHFGGSVPAMGVYLIAGNPCAFVDASAAWGFPNRMHRILVSLGGMYFESIIGIAAVFVWAFASSPTLKSGAHHIVFMATAVTLLFNANPLLKYDGYFVLCDLTGSPNLRSHATKELQSLLKRWFLGIGTADKASLRSLLLISYGLASSIYKFFVVISISTIVAGKFAALGLAMAGYYVLSTLYGIYSAVLGYLWASEEVRPVSRRARAFGYVLLGLVPLLLLMPVPSATRSAGRLTKAEEFAVTNDIPGLVDQVFAYPGQLVDAEESIVTLKNQNIVANFHDDASRVEVATRTHAVQVQRDRSEAAKTTNRLGYLDIQLDQTRHQLDTLLVHAGQAGEIMRCLPLNQSGQFLPKGTTVAIVGSGPWQVRFLADAETIMAAAPKVGQSVSVRLHSQAGIELAGVISRIAELGDRKIRDESLTHLAGGNIPVHPVTLEANESYFEVFVQLDEEPAAVMLHGMTVEVRMPRRLELVAHSLYRRVAKFISQVTTG